VAVLKWPSGGGARTVGRDCSSQAQEPYEISIFAAKNSTWGSLVFHDFSLTDNQFFFWFARHIPATEKASSSQLLPPNVVDDEQMDMEAASESDTELPPVLVSGGDVWHSYSDQLREPEDRC
jgi:hypothetical protein